jgi:hypothetical protein
VLEDLRNGYVTEETARTLYGLLISDSLPSWVDLGDAVVEAFVR